MGCCDGNGQVSHGDGALSWVTLCPNGCGSAGWDAECADERELQTMATNMAKPLAFRVAAQRELSRRAGAPTRPLPPDWSGR